MEYIDHFAGAQENLIGQYQGKPVISAVQKCFAQELNTLETVLADVLNLRPFGVATGLQLDGWGQILGEARNGRDDTTYRSVLTAAISAYNSTGTAEELLALARLLFRPAVEPIFYEQYPATAVLEIYAPNYLIPVADIEEALQRAKPAGVTLNIVVSDSVIYFGFDEDTNPNSAGFDDGFWSEAL